MRDLGFEPHTEQMLNAGNGLQLLNMGRQEPTLPVPDCNQISLEFYIPQHTCAAPNGGELLLSAYCMHPLPTGGTGLLFLY